MLVYLHGRPATSPVSHMCIDRSTVLASLNAPTNVMVSNVRWQVAAWQLPIAVNFARTDAWIVLRQNPNKTAEESAVAAPNRKARHVA